MSNADATIAQLRGFFCNSLTECEVPFMLAALDLVDDAVPAKAYDVAPITKAREVRNRLLSIPQQHADVLCWMAEERDWHPRIRTLFSWPGVAVRTLAAQWALAVDGRNDNDQPTGDHGSRAGVVGYLVALAPGSDVVRAIREETSRRVGAALRAYEAAA